MKLKFKKLSRQAGFPRKTYENDLGFDIPISEQIVIPPFETKLVKTDLAFEFGVDYGVIIKARSSIRKLGVLIDGVIDSDYRGEIKIMITNINNSPVIFEAGEYIAQGIVVPRYNIEFEATTELSKTRRGEGGFGSTGGLK